MVEVTQNSNGLGRPSPPPIKRPEGLVKQFDAEFPKKYFNEFLEYVSISKEGFFETVDKFRSPHLWTKVNGEWSLNKKVFKS